MVRFFDAAEIADTEKMLESLFLWEPDDNLTAALLDLYSTRTVGYYGPQTKTIVMIEGSGSRVQKNVILAHEFTHALQDQHFDLPDYKNTETTDTFNARDAVVEGDARFLEYNYIYSLSDEEYAEYVWPTIAGPMPDVPFALREMLSFPYDYGVKFVSDIYHNGGWYSVNGLYENPPASTEQVMHPEKYHEREPPVYVSYPAVPGCP